MKVIKDNKKYKNIIYLLFVYLLLLITTPAFAQTVPQQSLKITPIINDLQLTSGKETTFPLTIQNLSDNPVGIHASLSGYDQIGEVPLYNQTPSTMTAWTMLSQQDILLSPHKTKTLTVTLTPPAQITTGGYYETIFLTPILNQEIIPGKPIILSRVGVLVLGTIGKLNYDDLAKKVTITNITPSQTILNSSPQTISFTVTNSYFTHFDAKPFLTITPLFEKAQTTLLEDKHVLPNSARIWQVTPQIKGLNIFYQLHLAVSIGNGKKVVTNTWFIVLPYNPVLLIIIIAAVLFLIIFKRRRLKKFVMILLKG